MYTPSELSVPDQLFSRTHTHRENGPVFIATPMFPPDRVGGIEIVVECLAHGLAFGGHELVVVSALYGDPESAAVADGQAPFPVIRTMRIPQSTFDEHAYDQVQAAFEEALERAARESGVPRIVHNHDYFFFPACRSFADRHGCLLVTTFHYCKAHELTIGCKRSATTVFRARAQKIAYRGSDLVVSVSHNLLRKLEHYYGPSPAPKVTIWNPVCLPSAERGCLPAACPAHSKVVQVVVAGRLSVEKGTTHAIDMLSILREWSCDTEWDFRLRLFGTGSQELALRECVLKAGLGPFVSFEGFRPRAEVLRSFRSASVLVMPCRYEPFGLVCLEAMVSGLPVVAAATGASAELITHRITGMLVETPEPADLAAAVFELVVDDTLREGIRQRAWETAWTRHCNNEFLQTTVRHYEHALSSFARMQAMVK